MSVGVIAFGCLDLDLLNFHRREIEGDEVIASSLNYFQQRFDST